MGEFIYEEEDSGDPKRIVMIYGTKGVGKTACALGFPGKITAVSMDNKTVRVLNELYEKDPRIKVVSGTKYYSHNENEYVDAGEKTHRYLLFLLGEIADRDIDWILIDGYEKITWACEMVMRKKKKLGPFDGFANLNWWKIRRLALRDIHDAALKACKKGVIYTTYSDNEDLFIQDGKPTLRKQKPKWSDVVEEETDIVIRVWTKQDEENEKSDIKFMATIRSSKFKDTPTGRVLNLTNRVINDALNSPDEVSDEVVIEEKPKVKITLKPKNQKKVVWKSVEMG